MMAGVRKREPVRNEGKACDAVVRCIERRTGEMRAAIRRPETDGIGPPVDFRLSLGVREYAIEHTQIEAIPGLIRAGEGYKQLIKPLINELSGTLPGPAVYALHFPIDTHLGVKLTDLDRIRLDLITWVRATAQCLYERNRDRFEREHKSPRYLDSIEAKPPGFHYPVRLCVRPARSGSEQGGPSTRSLCSGRRGVGGSSYGPAAGGTSSQVSQASTLQGGWRTNHPGVGERRYRSHEPCSRRRMSCCSTAGAHGPAGRDLLGGNRSEILGSTLHEARHRVLARGALVRGGDVPRGRPDRPE